ncbi:MAG: hypothetical protein GQ527_12905, partial [Bacteroidales bacterium]|nr:hypothetical protein [Bacteroidales bacterium]
MFDVDLSDNGMYCSFGGKKVHARIMGSGGFLFSVNSNPGGGSLQGVAHLLNSDDHSGIRVNIPELDAYFGYSSLEGNYHIPYVPEGNYEVIATKVGYYPLTFDDISFTE